MRFFTLVVLISTLVFGTVVDVFAKAKTVAPPPQAKMKVAVLDENFSGQNSSLAKDIAASLNDVTEVSLVSTDQLAAKLTADPASFDMVVFPEAGPLPQGLKDPLLAYLKKGGDMVAIGGSVFESIDPTYKTFPVQAAKLAPNKPYSAWAFDSEIDGPVDVVSPIARPKGTGISSVHTSRWIPLLYAVDSRGEVKGTAAAMTINHANEFPGSVWGYIGFEGEAHKSVITSAIAKMVGRIWNSAFLLDGGMDAFGYFAGTDAKIGADIIWAVRLQKPKVKFSIISAIGPIVYENELGISLPLKDVINAPFVHRSRPYDANYIGRFTAKVDLMDGDKVVDTITHDFTVANPNRTLNSVVSVKDGEFILDGKKWTPLGVDYQPSNAAGLDKTAAHGLLESPLPDTRFKRVYRSVDRSKWLDPMNYDPEIIERDLSAIESLGVNTVSIRYGDISEAPALVDFLERCRRHNLKVHVCIGGLNPLTAGSQLPGLELIKAARLENNDTVFAYDIGWDTPAGDAASRKRWDKDWQDWVIERYGSVENAVKDWGFSPTSADGVISGPTDEQIAKDGEWRVMVAAYRRFWDDFISLKYGTAVKRIKALDKAHLISARSGVPVQTSGFSFDLASGAKHLDFISPQPWNLREPDNETAGLTALYASFVSCGKPVFWTDCDYNVISGRTGEANVGQTDYLDAHKKLAALKKQAEPNYWLVMDRDTHTNGFRGILASAKDDYIKAVSAGSVPGLKTLGTGTNSLTAPQVAVGNKPLNGSNPPKYLNAEIAVTAVKTSRGRWVEPGDGLVIHVGNKNPLKVKIKATNTAEAEWLALPVDQEGAVALVVTTSEGQTYRFPIPQNVPMFGDVEFGEVDIVPSITKQTTVTLQMEATGRSRFGQKYTFVVAP